MYQEAKMAVIDFNSKKKKLKPHQFLAECPQCGNTTFEMVCDHQEAENNNAGLWVAITRCAECGLETDTDDDLYTLKPE